jgi:general secretion pathway protein M|uniref:type II secretion system protein GspM n=1 Tax=Sphingomonas sp. TaxID=28214 RepID=UPI0025EE7D05|nr:type II secretion system protein GspM [Sphingomonas sp.]
MIANLKTWFDGRSLREKRLLLGMAALAVLTLLWGGIIRPVTDALSSTRERYAGAVVRLGSTQARVRTVQELQQSKPPALTGPLDAIVRSRADAAGFPLASANALANDRVQIAINSARPAALLGWIADLEGAGILVDSMNVTNNGDKTVAVQLTLKARGR